MRCWRSGFLIGGTWCLVKYEVSETSLDFVYCLQFVGLPLCLVLDICHKLLVCLFDLHKIKKKIEKKKILSTI